MLTETIAGVTHTYEITDRRPEALKALAPDAPTLVFIHGWLLSRAYWQPLVEQLSTHYPCLTYDLRGFGDSEAFSQPSDNAARDLAMTIDHLAPLGRTVIDASYIASPYSLAAYAQDLKTLLHQLNIGQAWLLGHSLGGSVALWAAYLYPSCMQGVICVNAGGGIYIAKEFETFRSAGQQIVKYRPDWLQALPILPRIFSRNMVQRPLGIRWGQQRIRDFVRADRQAAKGALLETTTPAEVHLLPQVLGQIQQPVHFITATEDSIMPPRYVRYLASFHPHFKEGESVTELSDCGHISMVEQPETVSNVVKSVLEQHYNLTKVQHIGCLGEHSLAPCDDAGSHR